MKKVFLVIILLVFATNYFSQEPCHGITTVVYGGQTYHTVAIENQCWLKENLNIGEMIMGNQEQTDNGIIEKYCYDDKASNCKKYGGLYQWGEAVQYLNGATDTTSPSPEFSGNIQGICPKGWHIPTGDEFETLAVSIKEDGNSLIQIGQNHYASNKSGFSALLAGCRDAGQYGGLDRNSVFWSSSEFIDSHAFYMQTSGTEDAIFIMRGETSNKNGGFSIRCIKDE